MLAPLVVRKLVKSMKLISITRALPMALALLLFGCSAMPGSGPSTLSTGMTPDQAVQVMGEPDLKDNIADPNHSGASVQRYVWLEPGKAAIFGTDQRVANIQTIETNTKQQVEQQAQQAQAAPPDKFDPIETPLNYLFFPAKAATIYFGTGLSCATGGNCQKPVLPPPSAG